MKKVILSLAIVASLMSCSSSEEENVVNTVAPATYSFERGGETSVSFSGQTTRIRMADELAKGLLKPDSETLASLNAKFAHTEGAASFAEVALNASSKNVKSKVAASRDFFSANTTDAAAIKADFDSWIAAQVNDVFPNWNVDAAKGVAGQMQEAGGGATRWVNAKGLEYDQAIVKGLIGGLMLDQMLNNYLSTSVLDEASNVEDNNGDVTASGKNYTTMEHKWDEAFGYLYGNEANPEVPVFGADSYLNKYVGRLVGDDDFGAKPKEIYDAFKLGRAAIVAKDYATRDIQANILREKISEIIGIRAVYYLQQAKSTLANDKATAFHDLSEGYGFIYSLQFTRQPNTNVPYFTKAEVDAFLSTLMAGDGFWDLTNEKLDEMSATIASKFKFTVTEAGS
ncbi:DUF4856 domain-containing protein [uncultured Polaribacter sp.]|uniref:DUF4856 domain-containing protein n=1 Tax=uncultured Polaribacter sp. TaxID=174711 RepID=UPI002630E15A|nr:DUF4856 domain-containing protein [uncultured Polaribacter sp.]